MPMVIRDAEERDLSWMLAIYNEVIATSTAVYLDEPTTLDERRRWWSERTAAGFPVLVAESADGGCGFASFGEFRPRPGYRYTVEHSVYVRADSRAAGVGTALMHALFERASRMGKHVMVGGVDADNHASLRFHHRLGFEQVAHFRDVGFKFGRWLDLLFVQRRL